MVLNQDLVADLLMLTSSERSCNDWDCKASIYRVERMSRVVCDMYANRAQVGHRANQWQLTSP